MGLAVGFIGSKIIFRQRRSYKDVAAQADEVLMTPTAPINIPAARQSWVRGSLANFWGPSLPKISESGGSATSS